MLTLYYSPGACSLASHIALKATGLEHKIVKVNLAEKKCDDGTDYWTINPLGYVPALKIGSGEVMTEGVTILQYIAETASGQTLLGKNATERYRVLQMLTFVSSEIHKGFSPLFNPKVDDATKAIFRERLTGRIKHLNDTMKGAYLLGDLSVADFYLFTTLRWAPSQKVDLSGFPQINAFIERMKALPFVQAALTAEGIK